MGTGVGRPEDDRLVRGAECGVAAVRRLAGALVYRRKTEVTVAGSAQRVVLLQDRARHDVRACVGGEQDLAAGEVLAEAGADGIDTPVAGAHWTRGTAAGVIGLIDCVGG